MELACRSYLREPVGPVDETNWPPSFDIAFRGAHDDGAGKHTANLHPVRNPHEERSILMTRIDRRRFIRAPRGPTRSAISWQTEAALRMLMNNLDHDVAERPEELVVYGGIGRAARDWESFDRIVETLRRLEDDQTLLIQSGKPVGVFRTHANAPRVLIANSNLVPAWANWDHFHELDRKGLMMYGQMTAGSWIYIGTQGIVQGTFETFVEVARQHYAGDFGGRWILTAGLGRHGGCPAAGGGNGGRLLLGRGMPAIPTRDAVENRLPGPSIDQSGRSARRHRPFMSRQDASLGGPARQRRGGLSRSWCVAGAAGRCHRPDIGS